MLKVNQNLKVRVFNEGENVFEGTVADFLDINQYDEETIEFVNGLQGKLIYEDSFLHSGDWKIEIM